MPFGGEIQLRNGGFEVLIIRKLFSGRVVLWTTCTLALLLLVVYTLAPTRNHYWDGVGFALNIEGIAQNEDGHNVTGEAPGAVYYNPNHLLYNFIGRALYLPLKTVAPGIRALDVLVLWSIISSVAAACMLFHLLLRTTARYMVSIWLTLLFAFSATWWKFSTDANAYVPGTALLTLCAALVARRKGPAVVAIGLCHALAMLIHQIAICFYPAMLVALWAHQAWPDRLARVRAVVVYTLVSAGSVTSAYLAVWFVALRRPADPVAFLRWITFNGSDVLTRKPFFSHAADMLLANLRVLFGGKLSLALGFMDFSLLILPLGLIVLCVGLIVRALWRQDWRRSAWALPVGVNFPLIWLAGFLIFLSVWLTEYPYYRLFCLPAFVLLLGSLLRRTKLRGRQLSHPLPAFVVLMASLNLVMYIGPHARVEASPPLRVALQARERWTGDVVVYFDKFNCDNWWMKYFNMDSKWRNADLARVELFVAEVRGAIRSGNKVFLDAGVLAYLSANPEAQKSFGMSLALGQAFGISNAKHHIQFVEVRPR